MFSRAVLLALLTILATNPVSAQTKKRPPAKETATDAKRINSAIFSGSESRLHVVYYVQADCTSGPKQELRLALKAKKGDVSFEPMKYPISQRAGTSRAHCNGKEIDGVGVFYKSNDGFVGEDRFSVDVDYKTGLITRYNFVVNVR